MLQFCASGPRVGHLTRTVDPDIIEPFISQFTKSCIDTLEDLARCRGELSQLARERARLPQHRSGLAIRTGASSRASSFFAAHIGNHAAIRLMRPTWDARALLEPHLAALRAEVGPDARSVDSVLRVWFSEYRDAFDAEPNAEALEPRDPAQPQHTASLVSHAEERAYLSLVSRAESGQEQDAHQLKLLRSCTAERRRDCWTALTAADTTDSRISDRTAITMIKLLLGADVLLYATTCDCHAHGGADIGQHC